MLLKKMQTTFASDIINNQAEGDYLAQKNFIGADLIKIYRNNYITSLTCVLKASYSCVLRLVGEDFFNFLARSYITKHRPQEASLQNYGAQLAEFVVDFAPCKHLKFLVDIIKFERAYEMCYHSDNYMFLMASKYPIIKIWQLNNDSEELNLDSCGDNILIHKVADKVVVERLKSEVFKKLYDIGKNKRH